MKFLIRAFFAVLATVIGFYAYGRIEASATEISVEKISGRPPVAEAASFTIATYNIAHGRGATKGTSNWSGSAEEKTERSEAIGQFLAASGVDIVVLNEVDFDASWSGRQDQAMLIARAGGYSFVVRQVNFNLSLPGLSLEFGNALLSRYPIISAERVPLPAHSQLESLLFGNHDAIRSVVEIDGSRELELWALHLEVRDQSARESAVKHIVDQLDLSKPVVLAGDLNSERSDDPASHTALSSLLSIANLEAFPRTNDAMMTFPSMMPKRTLDWIVYSPLLEQSGGNVVNVHLSDHLPVLSRLSFLQ